MKSSLLNSIDSVGSINNRFSPCFSVLPFLLLLMLTLGTQTQLFASPKHAAEPAVDTNPQSDRFVAQILINTPEELLTVLERAERTSDSRYIHGATDPIKLVLHGAEAEVMLRKNYQKYRPIVKLAAQLDALQMIDVVICSIWLESNGYQESDLYDFSETTPSGPVEIEQLLTEGYLYF